MAIFSRRSRAATYAVHGRIWSTSDIVQDFIIVLVTCKNKEDPIKNKGARVFTTLYIDFSDAQGYTTLELVVVSGRNLNSSKLSCMSLLPERTRMIESKMKELECSQHFPIKVYGDFSRATNSPVLDRIWRNFELDRDVMNIFVSCKYEEDPIKMKALECSQHFPHYISMGVIRCHGNLSSDPIWPKT